MLVISSRPNLNTFSTQQNQAPTEKPMKKILIINEENNLTKLMVACLRKHDYTIIQAENMNQGLMITQQDRPNLVIFDHNQSRTHPAETEAIFQNAASRVLLISGDNHFDTQQAKAAGADAFLFRPFTPTKLRERVEDLLI